MTDFDWPDECRWHRDRDRPRTTNELLFLVLDRQHHLAQMIHRQGEQMTLEVDRLKQSVAALATVEEGVKTLLATLAADIRANAEDPAAINAVADQIDAQAADLTNAILINTPPVVGSQLDPNQGQDTPPADNPPSNDAPAVDGDGNPIADAPPDTVTA